MVEFLETGPADGPLLVFAHGAGAAMTSPFMERLAELLVERGLACARFEFAYMAQRRTGGKRRPPPRAEALVPELKAVMEDARLRWPGRPVLMGGKSMGGRVASYAADESLAAGVCVGLVCVGYPFHPAKKPEAVRTAHLAMIKCPTLIVQGERDPLGSQAEVAGYQLSPAIRVAWMPDGDHDLSPRAASGYTRDGHLAMAADEIAGFARQIAA